MTSSFGREVRLSVTFADALEKTRAALQMEGFGIISTIDMQKAFREKIGADFRPYVILGACNPPLAHKALTAAPEIGLLLPCNVTVEELSPAVCLVRLVDPRAMLGADPASQSTELQQVAADAEARLQRVAATLAAT
ncbi:MAG: DUF302 domain-containing protein [Acidobacteria bacterium]|nr:DUF302 domain-containing protein [Acidobacteriota bacterium]MBP8273523.1 DUF302 domain-containing protein [Acidobacteriota bacterium]